MDFTVSQPCLQLLANASRKTFRKGTSCLAWVLITSLNWNWLHFYLLLSIFIFFIKLRIYIFIYIFIKKIAFSPCTFFILFLESELISGPHTGIPWQTGLRRGSALEVDGDSILVREEGFYFVYSQVGPFAVTAQFRHTVVPLVWSPDFTPESNMPACLSYSEYAWCSECAPG